MANWEHRPSTFHPVARMCLLWGWGRLRFRDLTCTGALHKALDRVLVFFLLLTNVLLLFFFNDTSGLLNVRLHKTRICPWVPPPLDLGNQDSCLGFCIWENWVMCFLWLCLLPQSKSSKELRVPCQQELIPPAPIVLGVPGSNGPESTPLGCTTHDPRGWGRQTLEGQLGHSLSGLIMQEEAHGRKEQGES